MKEKINFKEVMSILSGLPVNGVNIEKSSKKIEYILRNTPEYTYDDYTNLKQNIKYFYETKGVNDFNRIVLNFKKRYNFNNIIKVDDCLCRIAKKTLIPMDLEVEMYSDEIIENYKPSHCPLPVVWRRNDFGEEEAFCPKCGKKLEYWICTTDHSIRSYTPCNCK